MRTARSAAPAHRRRGATSHRGDRRDPLLGGGGEARPRRALCARPDRGLPPPSPTARARLRLSHARRRQSARGERSGGLSAGSAARGAAHSRPHPPRAGTLRVPPANRTRSVRDDGRLLRARGRLPGRPAAAPQDPSIASNPAPRQERLGGVPLTRVAFRGSARLAPERTDEDSPRSETERLAIAHAPPESQIGIGERRPVRPPARRSRGHASRPSPTSCSLRSPGGLGGGTGQLLRHTLRAKTVELNPPRKSASTHFVMISIGSRTPRDRSSLAVLAKMDFRDRPGGGSADP